MDKADDGVTDASAKLNEGPKEKRIFTRRPPEFGVHDNIPFWDYLLWDAFGSGDVRKTSTHSPAHLQYDWLAGTESNAAMLTGRAIHACVLEPDTEWLRYAVLPEGRDRRSKDYKIMSEEYGKDFVLTTREHEACLGVRDKLYGHTRVGRLLKEGRPEVTFAWEDKETGLRLKGRGDWLNEGLETVFDLKTTGDAREHRFKGIAKDKGYPQQGVHYVSGLRHHDVGVKHYVIVAVETKPPYELIMYRISTKDLMIAEAHWRTMVDYLAWCVQEDKWPGYPEHTTVLHMGNYWESEVQESIAVMQEMMV